MLKISPMRNIDISAVVTIENLSFTAPKSEEVFRQDENKYLVAREDERVVGYIGIEKIQGETHIINTAVHPDVRRRGIGKKLVESILNDQDVFFLEVRVSNLAAQSLYKKHGFGIVGTRKNYYSNNGEDAHIMKKEAT